MSRTSLLQPAMASSTSTIRGENHVHITPAGRDYLSRHLPPVILDLIRRCLAGEQHSTTLAALARTCKSLNDFFEPALYAQNNKECEAARDLDWEDWELEPSGYDPPRYALAWAAFHGHVPAMMKALRYNADVNIGSRHPGRRYDRRWGSPVHFAILGGSPDAVQLLLRYGASLGVESEHLCDCRHIDDPDTEPGHYTGSRPQFFPLHLAICRGETEIARLLLAPADEGQWPPHAMAEVDYDSYPEWEGQGYGEPEPEEVLENTKEHACLVAHSGAIHAAAFHNQQALFGMMVQKARFATRSDWYQRRPGPLGRRDIINRQGPKGTPLHYAARSPRAAPETIKELVRLGASLSALDYAGMTPLMAAIQAGNWDLARTIHEELPGPESEVMSIRVDGSSVTKADIHQTGYELIDLAISALPPAHMGDPEQERLPTSNWIAKRKALIDALVARFLEGNVNRHHPAIAHKTLLDSCLEQLGNKNAALELVKLFLDLGAPINGQGRDILPPLTILLNQYRQEVHAHALRLQESPAGDIDSKGFAILLEHRRCMALMLEKGASITQNSSVWELGEGVRSMHTNPKAHKSPLDIALELAHCDNKVAAYEGTRLLHVFEDHVMREGSMDLLTWVSGYAEGCKWRWLDLGI